MSSTGAEAELNALRQLFAQQSQELQKERATSARLRLENEALRASRAAAAPPDYAEAKTPDGANPAPAAFAIGPPPPRRSRGRMGTNICPGEPRKGTKLL